MKIPFAIFEGYLKNMGPRDLSDTDISVLYTAFPGFERKTDRQREEEMERYAEMWVDYVYRTPFGPRRYAPTLPELPHARYSSIATDDVGDDVGVMMRELMAYHNWGIAGAFNVFDCCTLEAHELREWSFLYRGKMNALGVILLSKQGADDPYGHLGEIDGAAGGVVGRVAYLPYTVTRAKIQQVLDLRLLKSQEWFFEHFANLCNFANIRSGPATSSVNSFIEMLPTLMDPKLGSNEITTFVGQWLIRNGANGLIYPAARSNSAVWFSEGEIESAFGWCFVDYRGIDREIVTDTILGAEDPWDLSEHSAFDIRLIVGGKNTGSWWVQGPQQYLEKRLKDAHTRLAQGS